MLVLVDCSKCTCKWPFTEEEEKQVKSVIIPFISIATILKFTNFRKNQFPPFSISDFFFYHGCSHALESSMNNNFTKQPRINKNQFTFYLFLRLNLSFCGLFVLMSRQYLSINLFVVFETAQRNSYKFYFIYLNIRCRMCHPYNYVRRIFGNTKDLLTCFYI